MRNDPNFFRYVLFNETTFHNNGQLNRHNCDYWLEENPRCLW